MIDLKRLPDSPGCYFFKDAQGNIIYIGKAKNLKKRVSSYFLKKDHDRKTAALVGHISNVEFFGTGNETEALILENNLIKRHTPKYNIELKDAKRYAFIEVTDEEYPRLMISRRPGPRCYGPFVSAEERDRVQKTLRNLFKLRTCRMIPKKPCLRYHMGLCSACAGLSRAEYREQVEKAVRVLKGQTESLVKDLQEEMRQARHAENFEKALSLRDQITALEYLGKSQNMERRSRHDEDIINYRIAEDHVYLLLFNIYKGTLAQKHEFTFPLTPEFFREFMVQFYSDNPIPCEIIVPEQPGDDILDFLSITRGTKVNLHVPTKGEKKQLLMLVQKNIDLVFFPGRSKAMALQEALRLSKPPDVIECFDISHLGGTSIVGAMVQFRDGKPDKSNYRRFKIRTIERIDDFAAIREIVGRRYSRLKLEKASLPDLAVIDGGKGQLSSALDALAAAGVKLNVLALAKREEEIYLPGLSFPLKLDRKNPGLQYLMEIRDEAHRFAIKYNRLLRSKKLTEKGKRII